MEQTTIPTKRESKTSVQPSSTGRVENPKEGKKKDSAKDPLAPSREESSTQTAESAPPPTLPFTATGEPLHPEPPFAISKEKRKALRKIKALVQEFSLHPRNEQYVSFFLPLSETKEQLSALKTEMRKACAIIIGEVHAVADVNSGIHIAESVAYSDFYCIVVEERLVKCYIKAAQELPDSENEEDDVEASLEEKDKRPASTTSTTPPADLEASSLGNLPLGTSPQSAQRDSSGLSSESPQLAAELAREAKNPLHIDPNKFGTLRRRDRSDNPPVPAAVTSSSSSTATPSTHFAVAGGPLHSRQRAPSPEEKQQALETTNELVEKYLFTKRGGYQYVSPLFDTRPAAVAKRDELREEIKGPCKILGGSKADEHLQWLTVEPSRRTPGYRIVAGKPIAQLFDRAAALSVRPDPLAYTLPCPSFDLIPRGR